MTPQTRAPLMDIESALARVGGDRELLREIAEIFLGDYPRVLVEIREAASSADAQAIERAAHGLKGSVANFGAPAAVEAAFQIEIMGRNGNLQGVGAELNNLHQILTDLHGELTSL